MRKVSDVPILMVTSRDDAIDRVVGLELGADDYIAKPFNPREVVARVKNIVNRVERRPASPASNTPSSASASSRSTVPATKCASKAQRSS